MARNRDYPAFVGAGEMPGMALGAAGGTDAIRFAMQHDCRNADLRLRRQFRLGGIVSGVAGRIPVAMPIGLDDDIDEIGIVERCSR
jgi:hypothetical protein